MNEKEKTPSITELFLGAGVDGLEQPTPAEDQHVETEVTPDNATDTPSTPEPETIEIDGKKVNYSKADDGAYEYDAPPDYDEMSEADKAKFDRKAQEGGLTLAKLKQKMMQQNDKDKRILELENENKKLKTVQPDPSFAGMKVDTPEPSPAPRQDITAEELKKYFDVEDFEDLSDLFTTDSARYHKGFANMVADRAERSAASRTQQVEREQRIRNKIEGEGYTVEEVATFAKEKTISNLEVALDLYKATDGKTVVQQVRRKAPGTISPRSGITPEPKRTVEQAVNDFLISGGKP